MYDRLLVSLVSERSPILDAILNSVPSLMLVRFAFPNHGPDSFLQT